MVAKKKGAGGKLSRSEVVTVRLDPKLRFTAEMAARKQRRTLSSFIEWAIEEVVMDIGVRDTQQDNAEVGLLFAMNEIWDVEEADRFVKLAINYPELLTYEEERLWKVITEYRPFWQDGDDGKYRGVNEDGANFYMIRINWETLHKIVTGEASPNDLCDYNRSKRWQHGS